MLRRWPARPRRSADPQMNDQAPRSRAARPSGLSKDNDPPLATKRLERVTVKAGRIPEFERGLTTRWETFERGSVRLSKLTSFETLSENSAESRLSDDGLLLWESLSELDPENGVIIVFETLDDAELLDLPPQKLDKLTEEIRLNLDPQEWSEFGARLARIDKLGQDREPLIVAFWAACCAEKLGNVWLAAMAYHAFFENEADYAFGWLTAQLYRRAEFEAHFMRGKKIVEDARKGGKSRATKRIAATSSVLRDMRASIEKGEKVSTAARLAFKRGKGKSPGANIRLWGRHRHEKNGT
jgi:hypothetical protein